MIQSDGKVGACCWDYNLQISGGGYGNVDERDLIDIWRSEKRQELDTAFAQRSAAIPEGCKSCIVIHEIDPVENLMKINKDHLESCGSTSFMYKFLP
jgi:radical SAM protein with 4Fe4S-binding SPASM domain